MESQKRYNKFYNDSLSSLQAIHKFRTRDFLVFIIKLSHLYGLTLLAHVSAHKDISGIEKEDILAKEDIGRTEIDVTLPVPT